MAKKPLRLAGPAQLSATAATKYTVPTGLRTLLRYIHFYNADTTARVVTLSIGADAAGTRIYDAYSIPAGSPYAVWCYIALEAAEIVQAFADVANKVTLTLGGDEGV